MMRALLASLAALFLPERASAQSALDQLCQWSGVSQMCDDIRATFPYTGGGNGVVFVAIRITNYLLFMIGGVAVAVIVYAGLQMVLSDGNDGKVEDAKKTVLYAAIGLVLAILADVVVLYVAGVVSGVAGA